MPDYPYRSKKLHKEKLKTEFYWAIEMWEEGVLTAATFHLQINKKKILEALKVMNKDAKKRGDKFRLVKHSVVREEVK